MRKYKKWCSITVGLIFGVSGILKVMDPVGTGLIVEAYFRFMHLLESAHVAKILGVLLGALEAIIGFAAAFRILSRITGWVMLGMQSAFTMISLALVIWNPQMHCGCFGEAIHLTHWQTFIKNIVLMGMLLYALFPLRRLYYINRWQPVAYIVSLTFITCVAIYSWYDLPLIDFTDYKKGTLIENHTSNNYIINYIYSKDDQIKIFDKEACPDTSWTFIGIESKKVKEPGTYKELILYQREGYISHPICHAKTLIVSIYSELSIKKKTNNEEFIKRCVTNSDYTIIILCEWNIDLKFSNSDKILFAYQDASIIKGLNRSNGGVTLISNKRIEGKWANNSLLLKRFVSKINNCSNL